MKNKVIFCFRLLLIASIICTLCFTFYQSLLPPEQSSEVSEGVSDAIEPIIPSDTPTGAYVHTNLRKIAHFVEFATLGLEVSLYVIFFLPSFKASARAKIKFILHSYAAAPFVALLDETIQVFTGRGPAIADVWLDTAGFFLLATLSYLVYLAVVFVRHRRQGISPRVPTDSQNG